MNVEGVLLVHNRYRQRGGEDEVVAAEAALLRERGHRVEVYERDNRHLDRPGWRAAVDTVWSRPAVNDIEAIVAARRPDVIHVHNTFPMISPAVYWVAARHGIPVVQTLHNFRLACVQAMFLRGGGPCERCLGHAPWRGVVHGCYRGSRPQSAAAAVMLAVHRGLGTFHRKVQRYIALNRFCRDKFVQAGLPAQRLRIKPNFVALPPPGAAARAGALFAGRVAAEKGTRVLAGALDLRPDLRVTVMGDGPEASRLRAHRGVEWRGPGGSEEVYAAMRRAAFLVMPSVWYEAFPRALVEAYACGLPVIAARIGAMAELVEEGRTGLLFEPGSAQDLARALVWARAHPERMREMGAAARRVYERRYTPGRNYRQLMRIYAEAGEEMQCRSSRHGFTPGPQRREDRRDAC